MGMNCTIAVYCDKCEQQLYDVEMEVYVNDVIGDFHVDTDMVLQEDGFWYCQNCDESLESTDEDVEVV